LYRAIHHAHIGDHTLVRVIATVENQGTQRLVQITAGGGTSLTTCASTDSTLMPERALMRGMSSRAYPATPQFPRYIVGHGGRQVDLVDHRDDGQILLERSEEVRHGLRLDALRGIDDEHCAFTGL